MGNDTVIAICRRHPDLVAVYESPHGKLGLLLCHTLDPTPQERAAWLSDTRRVARAVIAELHAAGLADKVTLLQWSPLSRVRHVLRHWDCRYEGDAARHAQMTATIRRSPGDGGPPAPAGGEDEPVTRRRLQRVAPSPVVAWYVDMIPSWLEVRPRTRRLLVLQVHRWIVEQVLGPMARGKPPVLDDLQPTGRLVWRLMRSVPADERPTWRSWIAVVIWDLKRALAWPALRRSDAWVRWLFLIPYSVPAARPERRAVPPPGSRSRRQAFVL